MSEFRKAKDEFEQLTKQMELPLILLHRERLVNVAQYQSEKFDCSMYVISDPESIERAFETMRSMMDAEEMNVRASYHAIQQQQLADRLRLVREEKLLKEKAYRKKVNDVFDSIKANPKIPIGDIAVLNDLTEAETHRIISQLQKEGRVKSEECEERLSVSWPEPSDIDYDIDEESEPFDDDD